MKFSPDKVLIFDIKGPIAHFRSFQTNSTSLSHSFPPPPTIYGLIAGILGFERDSYYNIFNSEDVFLAIKISTDIKKMIYTVNYHSLEEENYVQIPLEIVLPINEKEIRYRVYFSIKNEQIYENLKTNLTSKIFIFPPYLGISEFLAQIDFIGEGILTKQKGNEKVFLSSVFKNDSVLVTGENKKKSKIFFEYMRENFYVGRLPGKTITYLYVTGDVPEVTVINNIFKVQYNENKIEINESICKL